MVAFKKLPTVVVAHKAELVLAFLKLEGYTRILEELLEDRCGVVDNLGTGMFHSFSRPGTVHSPFDFALIKNGRLGKSLGNSDR